MVIKRVENTKFIFLLFALIFIQSCSSNEILKGRVKSEGTPLGAVVVTDGQNVTITDSKGRFTLKVSSDSRFVYISTPSGYLPADSLGVPHFYQKIDLSSKRRYDFDLIKNPKDDSNHVVLVHSDPQFFEEIQFEKYKTIIDDCIETIAQHPNADVFGIDCGDLVADRPHFYPKYIDMLSKTNTPFYRALGNHDLTNGGRSKEQSSVDFEDCFGPSNYSFNRGAAHYVVLNNVFYVGRSFSYMGYIDEKTFDWLEKDLSFVLDGSPVFIVMHIPARLTEKQMPFSYNQSTLRQQTVNVEHLFKILEPYNVHIFSGHEHYNKNILISPTIYEHNTAAISGSFWQGSYCWDGTPMGYGVYEINGSDVEWYFKSAGKRKEHQMRIYPAGSLQDFPDDIIANVWNWDKNWKVEWAEDGEVKGEMSQFSGFDPGAKEMCDNIDDEQFSWLSPVKTDHLFRATPFNESAKIKVIVTDRFGNQYVEAL